MSAPVCRTCGSEAVRRIGGLPDTTAFAGMTLPVPLPGGSLWRCRDCHLTFRHPILPDEGYRELYKRASAEVWESDERRIDFDLICAQLGTMTGALRVLDVGCYTGRLLKALPANCQLFGVEPSEQAAQVARSRGIDVIAASVEEITGLQDRFDVITACDVIEHVSDPLTFLKQLRALLNPGGRLLVSTGDSSAWLWRLAGASYWYCYFPEHISFISPRWLQRMAPRAGLQPLQTVAFNYRFPFLDVRSIRPLIGAALYALTPSVYRRMKPGIRLAGSVVFAPPGCGAVKDHLLCTLVAT